MSCHRNYHQYPNVTGSSVINVGSVERVASITGGALLTGLGIRKGGVGGIMAILSGLALIHRGATGHCALSSALGREPCSSTTVPEPVHVHVSITVNKPREEVYAYWRAVENLPKFMRHLTQVNQTNDRRSHWEAKVPGGLGSIEWEAEITREKENELIAWKSVDRADVDNSGEVQFRDAPGGRGTDISCTISYRPPQGSLGKGVAQLFNPVFKRMIRDDIRRFKEIIEGDSNAGFSSRSV